MLKFIKGLLGSKMSMKDTNNPFSLRYNKANKWQGQTGEYNGFVVFSSLSLGIRAGLITLYTLSKEHGTLEKIIEAYAPSNENNTKAYLAFIEAKTGCSGENHLKPSDFPLVGYWITFYEGNFKTVITEKQVEDIWYEQSLGRSIHPEMVNGTLSTYCDSLKDEA